MTPENQNKNNQGRKRRRGSDRAAMIAAGLTALGAVMWVATSRPHSAVTPPHMIYTSSGYGGFVPAPMLPEPSPRKTTTSSPGAPLSAGRSAEAAAVADYAAGRYAQVDAAGGEVIQQAVRQPTQANRFAAARVRDLMAYAAARRHDLALARVRFASARVAASALPGGGAAPQRLGEDVQPTLAEDAAYEHAVCTGALGNAAGAEAEYLTFMRTYPDSPLVMASLKRIARLHKGDVPPAEEAIWKHAMAQARGRQEAQAWAESLCGPACVAELLRRTGRPESVDALAREMHTGAQGTTLAALATAAGKRGWHPQGLLLTAKGLGEQSLPVIALVEPGHYVLVDHVTPQAVTVWDPDGAGLGRPAARAVTQAVWARQWQGVALALQSPQLLQTASR